MPTKDYNAIARARITSPSKRAERKPRILVYGRNKKGKTRFGATAPNVLVIDPEKGTDHEKKIDPDVWPVNSWEDMDDVYKFLREGKHNYEWVFIDGLTRIANMSLRWVMFQAEQRDLDRRPGQVGKQDYGKSGEAVKAMLYNFHALENMGVIFSAQERMMDALPSGDEDEDSEDAAIMYVPDLPKGVRGAVNSIVDVIGRIYTVKTTVKVRDPETKKVVEKEVIQRRLWVEPHVSYDTGFRSDHPMPPYLKNPTVEKLTQLLKTGKAA
jgi:hypothetical protein